MRYLGQKMTISNFWDCSWPSKNHLSSLTLADPILTYIVWNEVLWDFLMSWHRICSLFPHRHVYRIPWSLRCQSEPLTHFVLGRLLPMRVTCFLLQWYISQLFYQDTKATRYSVLNRVCSLFFFLVWTSLQDTVWKQHAIKAYISRNPRSSRKSALLLKAQ